VPVFQFVNTVALWHCANFLVRGGGGCTGRSDAKSRWREVQRGRESRQTFVLMVVVWRGGMERGGFTKKCKLGGVTHVVEGHSGGVGRPRSAVQSLNGSHGLT